MVKDDFIGKEFDTPTGGVLTVIGKEIINSRTKYLVECSICNKDKELFPDVFKITKTHLLKGRIPCGCSKNPNRSEYQWQILVKRICKIKGYDFLGWYGKWSGVNTKIILYNPISGNTWDSCTVCNFIHNNTGDPAIHGGYAIDDIDHTSDFFSTGKFKDGTKFCRSDKKDKRGKRSYWLYTCSVCSEDEYVKHGVCNGIFEASTSNLKKGNLSCRCAKTYRWTEEQREYKIKKILEQEGGKFIHWSDEGYKDYSSKFKWVCHNGHSCETGVSEFVNSHTRCPTCSDGVLGFYTSKLRERDYLYIISSELDYFKVGRTFNPERRLKENQSRLNRHYGKGEYSFKQDHLFEADHVTIYNLEQLLVGIDVGVYDKNRPENTYGSNELIKEVYYENVVKFCRDYINEWWI